MATTRGYVAVNFSLDARTDKVECVARQDMTIEGKNGASISLSKGEKFTAVRAASLGANMWYIVRDVFGEKKCSCPAMKPCKHEIAVSTGRSLAELQTEAEARKARKVKVAQAVRAKVAESVEQTTVKENASVNILNAALTKNQGFCIMR